MLLYNHLYLQYFIVSWKWCNISSSVGSGVLFHRQLEVLYYFTVSWKWCTISSSVGSAVLFHRQLEVLYYFIVSWIRSNISPSTIKNNLSQLHLQCTRNLKVHEYFQTKKADKTKTEAPKKTKTKK